LYAAYGTDTWILLGIHSDLKSSVKSIIDFTISRMSVETYPSKDGKKFVDEKCRFVGCKIRPHCINVARVCAAACQDIPIPNDELNKPLIIVFDDNPTLVKAPDISDVWVRQDKRWLNLTPHNRTHDINLRIIEKSKFLARKQEGT
ncbi:MAG: hypothetical protein J5U16_06260, partial [Candidatus Methanoperedens sp.]|nr:hypothetical protein [Candidatus Methanoperedens sp.]